MDVAGYTQSRYGRLIEYAVELGAPEGTASAYVDQVLLDQRRRIKRSSDPDPIVREALAQAIGGRPRHSRELLAIVLVVAALLAAIGLTALVYAPPPGRLPSVFGYDGAQARALLESDGYDVLLRPARACEPTDLVLSTSPRVGEVVPHGSSVSVRTAVPSDDDCPGPPADRSDAWRFVAWALGIGPAPDVANEVAVIVDGSEPATLDGTQATRRSSWGTVLETVATAAATPADTINGMPALAVTEETPPATSCGTSRPVQVGERVALRLAIDPARDGLTTDCPLTVDLYRTDGAIDTVVVHTPIDGSP